MAPSDDTESERPRRRRRPRRTRPPGDLAKQLSAHFEGLPVPYLFIGAGLSIRYAKAESWTDLLRRFAEPLEKPYEYYSSTASGEPAAIASLLSSDFHELWWSDPAYEPSRALYADIVSRKDSALKVEISAHLSEATDHLPTRGVRAREIDLLKRAEIDGIITTNFDPVLEHLRPDLKPYIGQDELLFSGPQGVGEIYKIHGSCTAPNSLVLTAEDYERFDKRNAYLVAKLLTIFVERPVVFLGYSLTDKNIRKILVAIAECMTDERIDDLRDRLLFVEWTDGATPSMTSTVTTIEGFSIPIHRIEVPDFIDVFTALAGIKRTIPARLLRHLRKEVHELVRTSEPTARAYVEELAPGADLSGVEVYAGFGAIAKVTTSYVGLERDDLLEDLIEDRGYDPGRVVLERLSHRMGSKTTQIPIYKYLARGGFLTASGSLRDEATLPPNVVERVAARADLAQGGKSYAARAGRALDGVASLDDLRAKATPDEVLYYLPFMDADLVDPTELRTFLAENRDAFDEGRQPAKSAWAKAVCLYDWLEYGASAS